MTFTGTWTATPAVNVIAGDVIQWGDRALTVHEVRRDGDEHPIVLTVTGRTGRRRTVRVGDDWTLFVQTEA